MNGFPSLNKGRKFRWTKQFEERMRSEGQMDLGKKKEWLNWGTSWSIERENQKQLHPRAV